MQDFTAVRRIKQGDKDLITFTCKMEKGDCLTGVNIEILQNPNGSLSCMSLGGDIFQIPALTFFHSLPTWPKCTEEEQLSDEEVVPTPNVRSARVFHLCSEE